MTGCNWEVTLSQAVRENFSEETTFKFNNYTLYIHGKQEKTTSGPLEADKMKLMRGGEGEEMQRSHSLSHRRKRRTCKRGAGQRASSRVTRQRWG